jgi:endonuclease YncB( thermonuclease family)
MSPTALDIPTDTVPPPGPTAEATATERRQPIASERQSGLVLDVVDGDTIDVAVDGDILRVRYLGVDSPERGMKSYLIAKDLNRSLVYMRQVELERDVRDKEGMDAICAMSMWTRPM